MENKGFKGYAIMKNANGVVNYFDTKWNCDDLKCLYNLFKTRKSAQSKLEKLKAKQPEFNFEVIEVVC